MTGRTSSPGAGSGPALIANSWYWSGAIAEPGLAVQVTTCGAVVSVVPETSTGLGSLASVTTALHPGTGRVETELSGVSCGRVTTTLVVEAVGDSFGTRNVSWAKLPEAVESG